MGVTGLWRLIDASGKPVPLESLEGKVLAIDISIWIHQVLQGYQDKRGGALPNAHLLGLFNRICKILYFKIKPVFVFDGAVPLLKRNTIAHRKRHKALAAGKAEKLRGDLLTNLMKHSLVKGALKQPPSAAPPPAPSPDKKSPDDIFKLPPHPPDSPSDSSDSVSSDPSPRKQLKWKGNIHTVDVTNEEFKSLPADVRFDILTDLKETRKQNSWAKLREIPEELGEFSSYQMNRLLKRRRVQECLEAAEQEMGGKNLTLEELERLMMEQGVDTAGAGDAYRIASDSVTRMIYLRGLKSSQTHSEEQSVMENMAEYDLEGWSSEGEASGSSAALENFGGVEEIEISKGKAARKIEPDDKFADVLGDETEAQEISSGSGAKSMLNNFEIEKPGLLSKLADVALNSQLEIESKELIEQSPAVNLEKVAGSCELSDEDFVEVEEIEILKAKLASKMEIFINPDDKIEDSLFADVFGDEPEVQNVSSGSGAPSKIISSRVESILPNFEIEKPGFPSKLPDAALNSRLEMESKELIDQSQVNLQKPAESCESSDEDFVEVEEIEISKAKSPRKMEIFINPADKIEDSLFTDVFEDQDLPPGPAAASKSPSSRIESILSNFEIEKPGLQSKSTNAESLPILNTQLEMKSTELIEQSQLNLQKVAGSSGSPEIEIPNPKSANKTEIFINPADVFEDQDLPSSPAAASKAPSSRLESILSNFEIEKPGLLSKLSDVESLPALSTQLDQESEELREGINRLERESLEVTDQMRSDAQELLRLFGIPYVLAPEEAEAQCAHLESIGLTDGTITDDSDIWLFGGRCVYRNFFNSTKRVTQYSSLDIKHRFNLTRDQMVQLALLVGSDYTVGLQGVGPVTALEILASFPSHSENLLQGLADFSAWLRAGRAARPGTGALRNKLKSIDLEVSFPSQAVVQAYLFPNVDESREEFTWGKPNLVLLADYTREKFGWTRERFEVTVGPVMKRLEAKSQKSIMSYFKLKSADDVGDGALSKRVLRAVERMGKGGQEPPEEGKKAEGAGRKRKRPGENQEVIPQRERDRENSLRKKLKAIELFRKSSMGKGRKSRAVGRNRAASVVRKEAELSESSTDSN